MGPEEAEHGTRPERKVVQIPAAGSVVLGVVEAAGLAAVERRAVHEIFRRQGEAAPEVRDVEIVRVLDLFSLFTKLFFIFYYFVGMCWWFFVCLFVCGCCLFVCLWLCLVFGEKQFYFSGVPYSSSV